MNSNWLHKFIPGVILASAAAGLVYWIFTSGMTKIQTALQVFQ